MTLTEDQLNEMAELEPTKYKIIKLAQSLRRGHIVIGEDCWHSCPKAIDKWGDSESCNTEIKEIGDCICGADEHNARLDVLIERLCDIGMVGNPYA